MIRSSVLLVTALLRIIVNADDSLSPAPDGIADPSFFNFLLETGEGELAALEYDRLIHEQSGLSAGLSCKFGDALRKAGNYEKAEYAYENALASADADSDAYAIAKLGLARSYLLQRKPFLALNELNTFDVETGLPPDKELISFYKSAAHAASYAVDTSKKILNSIADTSCHSNKVKQLDTLLEWYKSRGLKNPFQAYIYSSYLPGRGHWYIGDRKKAVKSFLLMAGLSGLLCYEGFSFYRGNVRERYVFGMDIFIVSGLLWRRYYKSIRNAAHQQAVEYNQLMQLEYQKRLREIIAD